MACFCSVPLGALLDSLPRIPPLGALVPPMSMSLVAAAGAQLGFVPAAALSLSASASAAASASAVANLSAMANLSAALQAALGMNLGAALSASATANVRASLSAAIHGFNANGGVLSSLVALLEQLLRDLLGLVQLSGLLMSIRVAFDIDMRAAGAIAALQARLAAMASASARATATASAAAHLSATASLMAALGFKADAQGALAVNAQAQATAGLLAGLPAFGGGLHPLALLAAVLAMLEAILKGLGVNLLAASARLDLRLALSALPLAALAQLSAQASAQAQASASLALAASAGANAAASLDLAATAGARLSAAAQVSSLLSVMAMGRLGMPAGSCGGPCPLALLQGVPASASASDLLQGRG